MNTAFLVYLSVTCFVLQASSLETKQVWVKKMRELIQERILYMHDALKDKQPTMFKPPPKMFNPSRVSR